MITEREKIFFKYWETKRKGGKWRFALTHGAIFWGIPVYLCIQLFYYFFKEGYVFETGRFVTGFIAWLLIGFFGFGLLMWWLNERAYNKFAKNKNPDG